VEKGVPTGSKVSFGLTGTGICGLLRIACTTSKTDRSAREGGVVLKTGTFELSTNEVCVTGLKIYGGVGEILFESDKEYTGVGVGWSSTEG
jgi:hypothetical protein